MSTDRIYTGFGRTLAQIDWECECGRKASCEEITLARARLIRDADEIDRLRQLILNLYRDAKVEA